jgi:hypothetical protein
MLTVQSQIQELAQQKLVGRSADVPGFADLLLGIAEQVGTIRGTLAGDETIRFEIQDQQPLEVRLENARSRLRTLCARLGYRCIESGQDISLYGGEGTIKGNVINGKPKAWSIRFTNTTDKQEFTIVAE